MGFSQRTLFPVLLLLCSKIRLPAGQQGSHYSTCRPPLFRQWLFQDKLFHLFLFNDIMSCTWSERKPTWKPLFLSLSLCEFSQQTCFLACCLAFTHSDTEMLQFPKTHILKRDLKFSTKLQTSHSQYVSSIRKARFVLIITSVILPRISVPPLPPWFQQSETVGWVGSSSTFCLWPPSPVTTNDCAQADNFLDSTDSSIFGNVEVSTTYCNLWTYCLFAVS